MDILLRGTNYTFAPQAGRKRSLENALADTALNLGYQEIMLPSVHAYDPDAPRSIRRIMDSAFKFVDYSGKVINLRYDMTEEVALLASQELALHPRPLKIFYLGKVFRRSCIDHKSLTESSQMGAEIFGASGPEVDAEVISTAVLCLKASGCEDFQIRVGHVGITDAIMEFINVPDSVRNKLRSFLMKRDMVALSNTLDGCQFDDPGIRELVKSVFGFPDGDDVLTSAERLSTLDKSGHISTALTCFKQVLSRAEELKIRDFMKVDLGLIRDLDYYTGTVFEVYAFGQGGELAGGGRYDGLMSMIGHPESAAGFAINIDRLFEATSEEFTNTSKGMKSERLTVAISAGRLFEEALTLFKDAGLPYEVDESSRKLKFEMDDYTYIISRPSDVPIYVSNGVADLGIVGKDVIFESGNDLCELLDLGFGKCRFVVAGPVQREQRLREIISSAGSSTSVLKVATKFSRTTERFFAEKGVNIEVIPLKGAIELAPATGLADVIVDIVSTGRTLKENNLCILEEIYETTARLVANRASFGTKSELIKDMVAKIQSCLSRTNEGGI